MAPAMAARMVRFKPEIEFVLAAYGALHGGDVHRLARALQELDQELEPLMVPLTDAAVALVSAALVGAAPTEQAAARQRLSDALGALAAVGRRRGPPHGGDKRAADRSTAIVRDPSDGSVRRRERP
jgi:hypothetical protein